MCIRDSSWGSGYLYDSKQIRCFSHVHNWQMSGVAVMPTVGEFKGHLGMDLTEEIPVIKKAVAADPHYLFPDCMTMGFGDTHPGKLNPAIFARMRCV